MRRRRLLAALLLMGLMALVPGPAHAGWYVTASFFGNFPTGVDVNPETNTVYVANTGGGTVTVYDAAAGTVRATVPTAESPGLLAVDPVRNRIWVTHEFNNLVAEIDGATNSVVATFPVGTDNFGLDVNPVTNRVYIANPNADTVTVLDGATRDMLALVPVGRVPLGIAVNGATNRIYANNFSGNSLSVIDGDSNAVIATVPLRSPLGIGVDPVRNRIYVTSSTRDVVFVLDGATNALIGEVPVGDGPRGVGVDVEQNLIFVANSTETQNVSVIDGETLQVLATPRVSDAFDVAVNSHTHRAYVTSPNFYSVSVVREDPLPPVTTITTPDGSILRTFPFPRDEITGTVADDLSGVDRVLVTFTPPARFPATQEVFPECPTSGLACTWHVLVPFPGVYLVNARSIDHAQNEETPGPTITVIVV